MSVETQATEEAEALVGSLINPPFSSDPYPACARLRELAPMHNSALGFWVASDHLSCLDVYRSPVLGQGFNSVRLGQDPRFEHSLSLRVFGHMLSFMDPPDHTRIRRLLAPWFTPRAIEGMRRYTEELVGRLLDRFERDGGGDLVGDLAENIPVSVVCELLGGVGEADQEQCKAWSEGLTEAVHPLCDETMMRHADEAALAFREYFQGLIAAGGGNGDDLLSRLLAAKSAGEVDDEEMLATATTLVGAAHHNTRNHIAMAIYTLLRHPDQAELLRADLSHTPAAVEEVLRFEPPVQISLPRVALTDVKVGEIELQEGEQVCALLGGANRDPARYRDPDSFDITRTDGGSLALAFGIHSCVGAAMARLEAGVAVQSFFGRFPRVTLVDEDPALDPISLPLTRGFRSVRVEIG